MKRNQDNVKSIIIDMKEDKMCGKIHQHGKKYYRNDKDSYELTDNEVELLLKLIFEYKVFAYSRSHQKSLFSVQFVLLEWWI